MRVLKYAILGLLNQKSMSGYELSREFESSLNEFWNAKHSQIYPELRKLTDERMITYEIAITGNILEKKVYTITESGHDALLAWLAEDITIEPTPKDNFRLRVFFSNNLPLPQRDKMFRSHLTQHKQRLEYLENQFLKFESIPDTSSDMFGDYLVLTGAIMREKTTCQWLKKCLSLMNNSD